MKKYLLIGIILFAFVFMSLITSYFDSARVRNGKEPKYVIRLVSNDGNKVTYIGLGYKVILYPSVSPNEPYKNNRGVKYGNWLMKYEIKDDKIEINLNELNEKINNYFIREDVDKSNVAHWGVIDNHIEVGMLDISKEKQNELMNNVFSKDEVKYLIENKIITFVESKDVFDAEIIEVENDYIIVKVIKKSKAFKKGDKVRISITRTTSGINDFYVIGNKIRVTFNGMVETSNPAQIGAYKIELIEK